ncbi:MAG: hypothetical protein CMH57_12830 [Myxococcales bacterium]|nr:hypothetical protein [Myxococcales bacterium]
MSTPTDPTPRRPDPTRPDRLGGWRALLLAATLLAACSGDPADSSDPADASGAADTGATSATSSPDVGADTGADDAAADSTASCEPGEATCVSPLIVEVCSDQGELERIDCRNDQRCDPDERACLDVICVAGSQITCTSDTMAELCNSTGTRTLIAPCPGNAACVDDNCERPPCQPGRVTCYDRESTWSCLEDGSGFTDPVACPLGQECEEGACQDLCTLNKKLSSYIGCEYWSLDLDNYDDALGQPHAIVISNPNEELTADIAITRGYGEPVETDGPMRLPPGEQGIYLMPTDSQISTVEISDKAFRVTSNIPITTHQFNPLHNVVEVFSNDGTLLLPTNALGTEYYIMSWEQRPDPPIRGFMTLVNTSGEANRVSVTASAATAPGPEIPRMQVGETREFLLEAGQVLNFATASANDDFTGTHVQSQFPLSAFGGHECANVVVGIDRCDHIESQLIPVSTWGTEYVGTKFFPRGTEPDIFRVLASEDATVIETDPPIPGVDGAILNSGEFAEFETRRHFVLRATAPVSLGHYMVGSNWFGIPRICDEGIDAGNPTGIGDPALTITVPFKQYRSDYIVLIPIDYDEDYINVVAPEGAQVTLDGDPVPAEEFEPVGDQSSGFVAASIRVEDGTHWIRSDVPVGLEAYGYGCHVSYAYPGGLNLEGDEEDEGE